jgi:CRP-like cAMP-binding protein
MAKLVSALDPARGATLFSRAAPPAPARAADRPKPPPLPPQAMRPEPPTIPRIARPAPLLRASDSSIDEVRFVDEPDSSVEILIQDFTDVDFVSVVEDESLPPTLPRLEPLPAMPPLADRTRAEDAMASFRLFTGISQQALAALSAVTELVEFVPAAMIIVRDERAFALYVIVSGTARVIVPGNPEIRLGDGDVFGEACLLDEGKRQADVRAETPLMALRVEKRALDEVTETFPEIGDALFDLLARRLIMNLMHTSPLFTSFEQQVRLELAQKFEVRRAEAGTVLAERGRKSDGLYILLAGTVMAEPAEGAPTRIARGTAFGHASLLGGQAQTTVRAGTEAILLRMPASGFGALAAAYPPALAHLAETANEPIPTSRRS